MQRFGALAALILDVFLQGLWHNQNNWIWNQPQVASHQISTAAQMKWLEWTTVQFSRDRNSTL
jgi:hypothetical protein